MTSTRISFFHCLLLMFLLTTGAGLLLLQNYWFLSDTVRAIGQPVRHHELPPDTPLDFSVVIPGVRIVTAVADTAGNIYIAGSTNPSNLTPTPGAYATTPSTDKAEIFVAKLNATGSAFLYATYLRGMGKSSVRALAVDAAGNAYVAGDTSAVDFPTTPGAYQPAIGNGATPTTGTLNDAFVLKLSADGSTLLYSTFLGGSVNEMTLGLAVDAAGNAYLTGNTSSPNFPTTPGSALPQSPFGDGGFFLTKLNASGGALVYSTYLRVSPLHGSFSGARAISVDAGGNAYLAGFSNAGSVLLKLNAAGSAVAYSLLLSQGSNRNDLAFAVALDSAGYAYVTGLTYGGVLAGPRGFQQGYGGNGDAFVSKIAPDGQIVFSTYLGGNGEDVGYGVAVDREGNVLVTGATVSINFPITTGALQPNIASFSTRLDAPDAFAVRLSSDGKSLQYSTFLGGGSGDEGLYIGAGEGGLIYLAGSPSTSSTSTGDRSLAFPVTPGTLFWPATRLDFPTHTGGFVVKLDTNRASSVDLTVTASQSGDFAAGARTAFVYQINNVGTTPTYSGVWLDAQNPGELFEYSSGDGWQCYDGGIGTQRCFYSRVISPGASSNKLFLAFRSTSNSFPMTTAKVINFSDTNLANNTTSYSASLTAPCTVSLSPVAPPYQLPEQRIGHAAANHALTVNAPQSCAWKAYSNASWITVNAPAGAGAGDVRYTVERNPGATERVGSVTVNNNSMVIFQRAGLAAVSAASFSSNPSEVAPGSIAALFGDELATGVQLADTQPLPVSLLGSQLGFYRNGVEYAVAPLFFVSPAQINFLVPQGLSAGQYDLLAVSGSGVRTGGQTNIAPLAPGLFSANATGQGVAAAVVLRVKADGAQSYEPVAIYDQQQRQFVAAPINFGLPSDQIFLLLFGTGVRNVALARDVIAIVGAVEAQVLFAGAQGNFDGLDQINVLLPRSLAGSGEVNVLIAAGGKLANPVKIKIK